MREEHNDTIMTGQIPKGLPGGFFVYEAGGDEHIVFAEPNVTSPLKQFPKGGFQKGLTLWHC